MLRKILPDHDPDHPSLGLNPGLHAEPGAGDTTLVTMVARDGTALGYFILANSLVQGELPPELRSFCDRVVGRVALRVR